MSAKNTSWFHCGRCGSLFLSPAGESDERFCSSCGSKPSLGIHPTTHEPLAIEPLLEEPHEHGGERKRSSSKRRKSSYFMLKLVLGWTAVLVAIVLFAERFWKDKSEDRAIATAPPAEKVIRTAEDEVFLNEVSPLCTQTLSGFLTASSPEERNQFVLSPVDTAARMARFYSMNPLTEIDPATLTARGASVVRLPDKKAVELQLGSPDGRLLDVVFVKQNDEWRIDWDHYVRYSDMPWALYLAGSGDPDGEFRLLARERLADERKNADTISLVLYAPRFGYASSTGYQSPEFIVRRDTREGKLLDAAFKLEREGKRVFGVNLPSINPEGLIGVRVKIRRIDSDLGRRFEISEIRACHWYSTDDPGIEIPEKDAEK